ncbi:MAG TPA: hypothetical protein DCZ03_11205 [Gammaproteobacteria bacterium]|nr:hypothetical protein [Gammaproteobacteria bacterium]
MIKLITKLGLLCLLQLIMLPVQATLSLEEFGNRIVQLNLNKPTTVDFKRQVITENSVPLTLLDAIRLAVENNENFRLNVVDLLRTDLAYQQSMELYKSDYRLQLRAGFQEQDFDDSSAAGVFVDDRSVTGVQATWTPPWWHKNEFKFDSEIASMQSRITKYRLVEAYRELALEIYEAYFDVVLQEEKVAIEEDSLSVARQQLQNIQEEYKLGNASRLTFLSEESNLLDRFVQYNDAIQVLIETRNLLFETIGFQASDKFTLMDRLDLQSTDINITDWSLVNDPIAQELTILAKQQQVEIQKLSKKWKPKLEIQGIYAPTVKDQFNNGTDEEFSFSGVNAQLSVAIPNFGADEKQLAMLQQDLAHHENQLSAHQTDRDIRLKSLTKQEAQISEKLQLLTDLVIKKKQEVKSAREGYEIGKLTSLELRYFENNAHDAQTEYLQALYDQMSVSAQIRKLMGRELVRLF